MHITNVCLTTSTYVSYIVKTFLCRVPINLCMGQGGMYIVLCYLVNFYPRNIYILYICLSTS